MISASLKPDERQDGALGGDFKVSNSMAGPLDRLRLPLESLSGRIDWAEDGARLTDLVARLPGPGRLSGSGNWRNGSLDLDLEASALDAVQLASVLRSTRLNGSISARIAADDQQLSARLGDTRFVLAAKVSHEQGRVTLSRLGLTAGEARLTARGELDTAQDMTFSAAGELEGFDPSRFARKFSRSNYEYVLGDDIAFVSFDQEDNWGGVDRKTKETRTLRKIDGLWKIAHAAVVVVSSFPSPSPSYHLAVTKIPPNPNNGFANVSGLGGMSIGYMDVPGPADFTPFFAGLPGDRCGSPHWGNVIDGSLRILYPGGKEDTVSAGEAFYWPAPHTGVVDKSVKFVDFSPDTNLFRS